MSEQSRREWEIANALIKAADYRAAQVAQFGTQEEHVRLEKLLVDARKIWPHAAPSPAPAASGELPELPVPWRWVRLGLSDRYAANLDSLMVHYRINGVSIEDTKTGRSAVAPIAVVLAVINRNSSGGGK